MPIQASFQEVSSFLIKILLKNDTGINKSTSIFSVKSIHILSPVGRDFIIIYA